MNGLRSSRLELHPDKTRLIEFGRHAAGIGKPEASGSQRRSTSWDMPTSALCRPRRSIPWSGAVIGLMGSA